MLWKYILPHVYKIGSARREGLSVVFQVYSKDEAEYFVNDQRRNNRSSGRKLLTVKATWAV